MPAHPTGLERTYSWLLDNSERRDRIVRCPPTRMSKLRVPRFRLPQHTQNLLFTMTSLANRYGSPLIPPGTTQAKSSTSTRISFWVLGHFSSLANSGAAHDLISK